MAEDHGIMDVLGSAAGKMITDVLRGSLRSFLERPRTESQPGPPRKPANRFLSRAAPVPLPPPAAVPPSAPAESQPPAPESKPASPTTPTLDFVGHVDRPQAQGSTRFPTEHLEDRVDRLDLNKADGPPRMKALRGPIITSRE